tara:strand:+ start:6884 stop:10348 length:3465 start_codon:yes stop_codon:yes gene_type:complete
VSLGEGLLAGLQEAAPVTQVAEELVPYVSSNPFLAAHEAKYKQLKMLQKLVENKEKQMLRKAEESKYQLSKTSSASPFRKALSSLRVKQADENTRVYRSFEDSYKGEEPPVSQPSVLAPSEQASSEQAPSQLDMALEDSSLTAEDLKEVRRLYPEASSAIDLRKTEQAPKPRRQSQTIGRYTPDQRRRMAIPSPVQPSLSELEDEYSAALDDPNTSRYELEGLRNTINRVSKANRDFPEGGMSGRNVEPPTPRQRISRNSNMIVRPAVKGRPSNRLEPQVRRSIERRRVAPMSFETNPLPRDIMSVGEGRIVDPMSFETDPLPADMMTIGPGRGAQFALPTFGKGRDSRFTPERYDALTRRIQDLDARRSRLFANDPELRSQEALDLEDSIGAATRDLDEVSDRFLREYDLTHSIPREPTPELDLLARASAERRNLRKQKEQEARLIRQEAAEAREADRVAQGRATAAQKELQDFLRRRSRELGEESEALDAFNQPYDFEDDPEIFQEQLQQARQEATAAREADRVAQERATAAQNAYLASLRDMRRQDKDSNQALTMFDDKYELEDDPYTNTTSAGATAGAGSNPFSGRQGVRAANRTNANRIAGASLGTSVPSDAELNSYADQLIDSSSTRAQGRVGGTRAGGRTQNSSNRLPTKDDVLRGTFDSLSGLRGSELDKAIAAGNMPPEMQINVDSPAVSPGMQRFLEQQRNVSTGTTERGTPNQTYTENQDFGDYLGRKYDQASTALAQTTPSGIGNYLRRTYDNLATGADRLGTRLLRPITRGAQGLVSSAANNFDLVRDLVGRKNLEDINRELYFSTRDRDYLNRMGEDFADQYAPGDFEANRAQYIQDQLADQMAAYGFNRPTIEAGSPQAQAQEAYRQEALDNLRNYYGVRGNRLGLEDIAMDTPYRDAMRTVGNVFTDPRRFLRNTREGLSSAGEEFINSLEPGNPIGTLLDAPSSREGVSRSAFEQVMQNPEASKALSALYPEAEDPSSLEFKILQDLQSRDPDELNRGQGALEVLRTVGQQSAEQPRGPAPQEFLDTFADIRNNLPMPVVQDEFIVGGNVEDLMGNFLSSYDTLENPSSSEDEKVRAQEVLSRQLEALSPEQASVLVELIKQHNQAANASTVDLDSDPDMNESYLEALIPSIFRPNN